MNGTRHEVAADLRRAYDAIPSPVTIFRASGEYVYLNPAAVEVLSDVAGNLVADDLIGQRWQEVFPAQVSTAFGEHFEMLATSPTSVSQPLITPAYESRSGSRWASRMWVDSRALVHVVSVKQDDDLPRAALQRVIRDFPFGACVVFDRDFRCISVTGQGLTRTGLDPSRLVGRTIGEVWPEDVCRILEPRFDDAFEGRDSDVHVPWNDGVHKVWVSSIRDLSGEPVAGVMFTRDATEKDVLRRRLSRVQKALDTLDLGISISRAEGDQELTFVSDGFEKLTGYSRSEVLGRNSRFLQGPGTNPDSIRRIAEAVAAGSTVQEVLLNYRKDGTSFWNRMTISPIRSDAGDITHFFCIQEDVSQQREAGIELEQSRRLSALGKVAGGLAHDMRNVLTGSLLMIDMQATRDDLPPDLRDDLGNVREVLQKGASITDRLLSFARDQPLAARTFDLSEFVRDRRDLLRTLLRESIEIRVDVGHEPVWVEGDPRQLDQALLNLAHNAEEAMPEGGSVMLRLRPDPPRETLRRHRPADQGPVEGPWVVLRISDTGEGMSKEVVDRAFEPFFTTRRAVGGTGLGLASVYGVVRGMKGICWIESSQGEGTDVYLAFPVVEAPPAREVEGDARDLSGVKGIRILVADDDVSIRRACERYLTREGADVQTAGDGREAARIFDEDPDEFDVLVTDAVMPNMSGPDLLDHVRAGSPDLPAVLISGYHEFELPSQSEGFVRLSKPFSMDELIGAIRTVLGGR